MRKGRIYCVRIVVLCMMAALFAGCGGPKVSPEESVKIYGQMVAYLDFTNANKIDVSKQEQENMEKSAKTAIGGLLQSVMSSAQVKINDEQSKRIIDAAYALQKKAEIQTELVSKTDKEAVVKFSISSMDPNTLAKAIQEYFAQNSQGMDQANFKANGGEIMANALVYGYEHTSYLADKVSFNVKCKLDEKANVWRPEDEMMFALNVGNAISGKANLIKQ